MPGNSSYQFGAFRLNPAERALLYGARRLDLPPRAFDTLVVLVAEKGNVVDKERLMRTIWPDTIVEENNLSQAVYVLRKVLRDGEDGVKYIETVPKQGYRFVARVRELESGEDDGPNALAGGNGSAAKVYSPVGSNGTAASSELTLPPRADHATTPAAPPTSRNRLAFWAFVGAVIVVLVLAVLQVSNRWESQRNRADLETIRSVAVLPLQNLSNDPEQEYFADGMTDELITDLAQVQTLRVVSHTSVMQYKGAHRPLPQIGRELSVDAVIEGSVLRSGDRVRITAQLIRTATDSHLWAKSYEGEMKDVLSLQATVAEEITSEVKLNLTAFERNRLRQPHPVNPEAYEAYLRGRFSWNRRDEAGFEKAIGYFKQAIAKDPDFALAYSGLADCYILMALDTPDPEKMAQAKTAALKALALDDGLAEAHTSLAAVKVFDGWYWAGAEAEFKRALEINPNYAPAHHWYGNILLDPLGRHEEAIAELKRAQGLDPASLIINTDVGFAYYLARRYDDALAQYQKVLAMDSSFIPVHYDLSLYYALKGMGDEWIRESQSIMDAERAQAARSRYVKEGFRGVLLENAATRGSFRSANPSNSFLGGAESYAVLGMHRQALAALQRACDQHDPGLIFLKVDPVWDGLRSDPAFQAIERRMGLQ
ncbi:MAG: winged helix-turn-helix domain-containing tetratricopeptide repeat protein [Terriglobales bacterium]